MQAVLDADGLVGQKPRLTVDQGVDRWMYKVKDLVIAARMPISVFRGNILQYFNSFLQGKSQIARYGVALPHPIQSLNAMAFLESCCLVPKLGDTLTALAG